MAETADHVDVLIVGAGLSGIGAAHHLQRECPDRSWTILEGRDTLGGTWDLFRYPGVRSDSDMYTLGYAFRPWTRPKAIADGASILQYLRETAAEGGIDRRIRYGHRVLRAHWSTADARWTVEAVRGTSREPVTLTCSFLFLCAGYYDYDAGHAPDFPGLADFRGRVVHPQHWTDDIVYADRRVVVIGSGATAVTLVPELAKTAAHVTMLQRSPTYVVALPSTDGVAKVLRRVMPARWACAATRWKNVTLGMLTYRLCKLLPQRMGRLLVAGVRRSLGSGYDVATHFTPHYAPWDQRICVVPDGDLFKAIRGGRASVVTDTIATFTPDGIRLASGATLPADLVVTATGLKLNVAGNIAVHVDGQRVDFGSRFHYKGLMFSDVPNFASVFGYTNASWTLKSDLSCGYVCRLLNHMKKTGTRICMPHNADPAVTAEPWVDFSSGYIQRALPLLPKQGSRAPWRVHQNYARDVWSLRYRRLEDGAMTFA